MNTIAQRILYEDNHILIFTKVAGELTQGDKTGDLTLLDTLKEFIKVRDNKPGNVFLGLPHRLDRPTSGIVVFAKTSKALNRLCQMFKNGEVKKTYLAIVDNALPNDEGILEDYLIRIEKSNISKVISPNDLKKYGAAKKAVLEYKILKKSDRYYLYSIILQTGRHHQIRAQLSSRGVHILGDLKYGAKRSLNNSGIALHSYSVKFEHPVSKKIIEVTSPINLLGGIWKIFV